MSPFKRYSVDENVVPSGGGSALLPEGVYLWETLGLKASPEDTGDSDPYFTMRAIARDGNPAGVGLTVSKRLIMSEKAMWTLGVFVEAVGMDFAAVQKLGAAVTTQAKHQALAAALSAKMTGKMFTAGVQDNDYTTGAGNTGTNSEFVMNSVLPASAFKAAPSYAGVGAASPGRKKAAADEDDEEEEDDLETRFKAVVGDDDDDDEDEDEEEEDDEEEDDEDDDEEEDEDEDDEPAPPARRGRPAAAPARRARR